MISIIGSTLYVGLAPNFGLSSGGHREGRLIRGLMVCPEVSEFFTPPGRISEGCHCLAPVLFK
jgi:hypothetical protein